MKTGSSFLTHVRLDDSFWNPIRETVRQTGIPYQWKALNDQLPDTEPSGCMRNFRIAAGREEGTHAGCVFQDSDIGKWLEGAAYTLRWHPDPDLEAIMDGAIEEIVAAQQPDGYLDTYYIINGLDRRWTNLKDHHELYCAGHLLEGAVAYYEATGKRRLLDAMIRFVDHIDSVLGPEEGKIHGYPGHPEIELALMRLYRVTGDPKHLRLASYFIDQRGQQPLYFREEEIRHGVADIDRKSLFRYRYYQAGKPVREQEDAEGHAVRALYLYTGMADVARETGDESLFRACRRLWESAVRRRMYITGGVGSSEYGESFTFDYDLPNDTVYAETCASIALVFFARRMLEIDPRGEYADVMERCLYNGILSGMQLDGTRFFYVNPLEVLPEACEMDERKRHVRPERQGWFACACCPPNLNRLVASLEDYMISRRGQEVFIHLFLGGEAEFETESAAAPEAPKTTVQLQIRSDYPRDGKIVLTLRLPEPARFCLRPRIPGWCASFAVRINGQAVSAGPEEGYLRLDREWRDGDTVELNLDMPVRLVQASPRIPEDAGKVAVARGPLVYCLEEADNGKRLHLLRIGKTAAADFAAAWKPDKLKGITELTCPGIRESEEGWEDTLYSADLPIRETETRLTFIPYYAWANRGLGEMRVWVRR